jgi:membrane fusion protein, heavy metal efflux system
MQRPSASSTFKKPTAHRSLPERWPALLALALSLSCQSAGHDHDHEHDHGAPGAAPEEEAPSLAITRWTPGYELFVELPGPTPGAAVAYHAHVTALADFSPVTEGTFRVRYETPSGVSQEHVQTGVKRPGIFVFEGQAPAAGSYALKMVYEHAGNVDVFDCGSIAVANPPVAPAEEASGGAITFPKESQWKIPFATDWAKEQPLASEMELAATVEPAAGDQLTVGAPTGGRFFHNPELALAEGRLIKKGDVLGTITPTVAGDDYSRLESAVEEARLARDQIQRDMARIAPLVKEGILPARRLVELENALETETARLRAASARLKRVVTPGGEGGLTIRSTLDGLVSEVLVPNGEPVEAGSPLARIGGTRHLWIRARFVAKPASLLVSPVPTAVRLPSGERIDVEQLGARFVSALPVIDPASQIATWIVDVPTPSVEAVPASPAPDLRPGGSVVLSVRLGKPELLLAVPRSAAVEINTRPYVFVQVDGEHFEKRAVTLGRADGPWIQIISGVKSGERVVTRGGYDIHLAALMGTIESHRH